MCREYTREEVRNHFVGHVHMMVGYWNGKFQGEEKTQRERLEGLAFSILSAIDGCSGAVPGFILAPSPHPNDKAFHLEEGDNWYPENHEAKVACDISGSLHEEFCRRTS